MKRDLVVIHSGFFAYSHQSKHTQLNCVWPQAMWNEAVRPIVSTIFAFDRGHFLSAAASFSSPFFPVWFLAYLTKSRFVHQFFDIHSSHRIASVCVYACVRLFFQRSSLFSLRFCTRAVLQYKYGTANRCRSKRWKDLSLDFCTLL